MFFQVSTMLSLINADNIDRYNLQLARHISPVRTLDASTAHLVLYV